MSEDPHSWDVVVVPFPYSDKKAEKRRPAVIFSSQKLHERHGIYWMAMITSARHVRVEGDIAVHDYTKAGLVLPCFIRPAKIAAFERSRILRVIGSVKNAERKAVKAFVRKHLAV